MTTNQQSGRVLMKQWLKMIGLCFLIVAMPAMASSVRYAIVVDAGSTGSRLFLFSYQATQTIPVIKEVYAANLQPGLSSYVDEPKAAAKSLAPLFEGVAEKLQTLGANPRQVSVSVLGTGGMRLLPDAKQKAIYTQIRWWLTQHYAFQVQAIETISGKTEGLYGWLDVNYLLGTLNTQQTYGNIDMGGATTQIAFEVSDMRDPENELRFHIAGRERIVYSKSFLGLGLEESRKAMHSTGSATSCYPHHYQVQGIGAGEFHFNTCKRAYDAVLEKFPISQTVKHIPNLAFIAYSGAYHTLDFFGLRDRINQGVVETNLQATCNHAWEELQMMHPTMSEKELSNYCAYGVYLDDLFYKGYQLQDSQVRSLAEVSRTQINWTLGALLYGLLA